LDGEVSYLVTAKELSHLVAEFLGVSIDFNRAGGAQFERKTGRRVKSLEINTVCR
jgi:hypothetical protein